LLLVAVDYAKFRMSGFLKLPIACTWAATSQSDEMSLMFLVAIFNSVVLANLVAANGNIEFFMTFYTG
jgi:hypothetical protein